MFSIPAFFLISPLTVQAVETTERGLTAACLDEDGKYIFVGDKLVVCNKDTVCLQSQSSSARASWTCQPGSPAQRVFGRILPPDSIINLGFGAAGISQVLTNVVQLIFIFASIIFLFMIIISAVQWITSGGDKEAVAKARGRITWAIIGITVLALAFVIAKLVGQITGFEFFEGQNNPSATTSGSSTPNVFQRPSGRGFN